jgi:histidyl-tRNA synthetase
MDKPSLPSGTRDFAPAVMARRRFITGSIEQIYRLHGFAQLETPAMENLSVLLGKYGDEGDKLVFRILNSGDFLSDLPEPQRAAPEAKSWLPFVAGKGLRYDLTVPFARFVAMNRHLLHFPFRRYQIQPVWRADRPQKGRYREFWQCDADVIGTRSLMAEADLLLIMHEAFTALGLPDYQIRVSNRLILEAIAHYAGRPELFRSMVVAIDKWDKIGADGVQRELGLAGFSEQESRKVLDCMQRLPLDEAAIVRLEQLLQAYPQAKQGLDALRTILLSGLRANLVLDTALARGLDYYTGCIFEAEIPGSGFGSVASGGRYDDLTGVFGVKDLSGVGISFGIDRLYDVLESRSQFPAGLDVSTEVLLCPMDDACMTQCFAIAMELRRLGVSSEVYPDAAKLRKQLDHANQRNIPYAIIVGSEEIITGVFPLKHLAKGSQEMLSLQDLYSRFRS